MKTYKYRGVVSTAHFNLFYQEHNPSDVLVSPNRRHTIKTEDLYYRMATDVLEKIWGYAVELGHTNGIIITGGYRTPEDNSSVYKEKARYGKSHHCAEYYGDGQCCAVDWCVFGWTKAKKRKLYDYIVKKAEDGDILFDQLISETRGNTVGWIHISYRPFASEDNRLMYFYMNNDAIVGKYKYVERKVKPQNISYIVEDDNKTNNDSLLSVESNGMSAYTKTRSDDMVERMKIKQITNPTIQLSQIEIEDTESDMDGHQRDTDASPQSKIYNLYPMLNINGYNIHPSQLVSFKLDCSGFLPRISYTFTDTLGTYKSQFYVDDSCVTRVYLRSPGNEDTYKPIRINFDVDKVYEQKDLGRFSVYGTMKVPALNKKGTNYKYGTSYEALLSVMSEYGLGFATNVENTNDKQMWLLSNGNNRDFVFEIMRHSYIDDDSFVDCFIDPYYNFNFVEMNRLLYQGGSVENVMSFNADNSDALGDKDVHFDEYRLVNNTKRTNSPFFYKSYELYNSPTITKTNGFKNYIKYWDVVNKCYKSVFVDAMTPNSDGMVSTVRGNIDGEDDAENLLETQYNVSYVSGATDNTHQNYAFATILNDRNMVDLEKNGINLVIPCYNPIITRYSRIWVDVYENNSWAKDGLKARQDSGVIHKDYASAPIDERENVATTSVNTDTTVDEIRDGLINKTLSGWYIVMGVSYIYEKGFCLTTHLELRRKERVL